jgi:hypothetical protein
MAMQISGSDGVTFPDSSLQTKSAATGQTGSAPFYSARAWVNFNGTGTVAIRASGNVSSITDNGTGDFTVNFTTAMPDVSYAVAGTVSYWDTPGGRGSTWLEVAARSTMLTTSVRVLATSASSIFDLTYNGVVVFR